MIRPSKQEERKESHGKRWTYQNSSEKTSRKIIRKEGILTKFLSGNGHPEPVYLSDNFLITDEIIGHRSAEGSRVTQDGR